MYAAASACGGNSCLFRPGQSQGLGPFFQIEPLKADRILICIYIGGGFIGYR